MPGALFQSPAGRTTLAYYLAFVALGLATAAVGPTLPGLSQQTGATAAGISIIFTTTSAGYILGSLISGHIYDRVTGHPVLALALLVVAGLLALVPLVQSLMLLALIFLLKGFFMGTLDVGGNTLIGWLHGSRVGPYMNGLHFFFGLGAFAAPLVVAAALATVTNGIAWSYWSLAALVALSALALLGQPSPANIYRRTGARQGPQPRVLIGLIVLFYFLYVGAEHTFGGWLYSYATSLDGGTALTNQATSSSATAAAYLNSAFWGAFTVGRLIGIPLAQRLRPRTILLADLLLALLSLALIVAAPASRLMLWIGVIGFGLALASIFPTMLTWAGRRIRLSGGITGLFFVGGSTGAMIFPWLTGQFFDRAGATAAMWTVFSVVVTLLVVFFVVMARGGEPRMASSTGTSTPVPPGS